MRLLTLFTLILALAACAGFQVGERPAPPAQAGAAAVMKPAAAGKTAALRADWNAVTGAGPTYYGVEYGWVDQDRELFLQRYRLLKPNVLRVQITQEAIEPVNDNGDPNASALQFDRTIPLDLERGKTLTYGDMFTTLAAEFPDMHFHINLWLPARWNAAGSEGYLGLGGAFPVKSWTEHQEFVRELARWLVEDCGIRPEHLSFSFVNEPNLEPFFVGAQDDLLKMAEETRAALDQVSPKIRLAGLDEVHGTRWTEDFNARNPEGCCDFWTFHAYTRGAEALWSDLQSRIDRLKALGPVWVTEFADTQFGSPDAKMDFSSREAALEFAWLSGQLWRSGIDGLVHFRLADTYTSFGTVGGWAGHGLMADDRGTHSAGQAYAPYPAFWVFANLYNHLGGRELVSASVSEGLQVTAGRDAETGGMTLWVTNPTGTAVTLQAEIKNYPAAQAYGAVLDNLAGPHPVQTLRLQGRPLTFSLEIPGRSSRTILLSPDVLALPTATPPTEAPAPECDDLGCLFFPMLGKPR